MKFFFGLVNQADVLLMRFMHLLLEIFEKRIFSLFKRFLFHIHQLISMINRILSKSIAFVFTLFFSISRAQLPGIADVQTSSKACCRIKQVDIDSNFSYSSIAGVARSEFKTKIQPNPFSQSFIINTFLPSAQPLKIQLLDMNGSLIRYKSFNGLPGDNRIEFADLGNLQAGVYMVRIIRLDSVTEQRIIKARQ